MLEIIVITINVALALILGITIFNVVTGPRLNKAFDVKSFPKVSVLIPARNEETRIRTCLESLAQQDYPNYEIIVLDDQSSDRTQKIILEIRRSWPHIRLVIGKSLPTGWTGKNWACHQLSSYATGDIFIFTDADTWSSPTAIKKTVSWMLKYKIGFATVFPQQITKTLSEKLVIPLIEMMVYTYLPIWFVYYFRSTALAAANGQWIAIKQDVYRRLGGHAALKQEIVEDVALCRLVKTHGGRVLIISGTSEVFCRMYDSWKSVWEGFSKNAYALTEHNVILFTFVVLLLLSLHVFPFALILMGVTTPMVIAIAINLLIRIILAIQYRHSAISVMGHPIGILVLIAIGINSFMWFKRGRVQWKGRIIERTKKIPEMYISGM